MTATTYNHLNYRYTENGILRNPIKRWAIKVKQRDSRCKICNSPFNLEAHHILPKSKYPHFKNEPLNGICLCHNCHVKADKGEFKESYLFGLIEIEFNN